MTVVSKTRLWPTTSWGHEVSIDVFGVTGGYGSGKTTMGISIAPGKHPEGHPFAGKARTLDIDLEKSSTNYGAAGFDHVDAPPLIEKFARRTNPRGVGYKPRDIYLWFINYIEKSIESPIDGIPRYDVIVVDPINDLDDGLIEEVRKNYDKYSDLSAGQAAGTLIYGPAKKLWKEKLLLLADKCQCFFFTTHQSTVWKNNAPSSEKRAKGLSVLDEVATIRLSLERSKKGDERGVPVYPSAVVDKQRISDSRTTTDEFGLPTLETRPLLPPKLPVATITEIRRLIAQPLDYSTLGAEYQVQEVPITETEMIAMRTTLAEAEERAALAKMEASKVESGQAAARKSYGKIDKTAGTSDDEPASSPPAETATVADDAPKQETSVTPPAESTQTKPAKSKASQSSKPEPESADRTAALEIIRHGVLTEKNPDGVISTEDYNAFCESKSISRASELSDAELFSLAGKIDRVRTIKTLIKETGFPTSKIAESLAQVGVQTIFQLEPNDVATFEKTLRELGAKLGKN